MEHELDVTAEMAADALANCPTLTIREQVQAELEKMSELEFGYNGHGELPIRPDSHTFFHDDLLRDDNDPFWEGLIIEAVALNPAGVPIMQLLCDKTKRRVSISVPCWGVVAWIQAMPESRIAVPRPGFGGPPPSAGPPETPKIIGFTRIKELADWGKLRTVTEWCKSTLTVRG